jgi:hypothetical protein
MLHLQPRNYVKFNEVVGNTGAGAKFDAVADFLAQRVQRVGRSEAMSRALRLHAACDIIAALVSLDCGFKSHD